MTPDPAEGLIRQLAEDLEPVRRVPRLRVSLGAVLVLMVGLGALVLLASGPREQLWQALSGDACFGGVFAGLLLAALAGSTAGLAGGVPGREWVFRIGGVVAILGLLGAVFVSGFFTALRGWASGSDPASDGMCFEHVVLFGALPALALAGLVVRGWVQRPLATAGLMLVGGLALGGLVVQATCTFSGARHLFVGHVSPLWVLALIGAVPLALLLRRLAR
jgi:hypothetical protein